MRILFVADGRSPIALQWIQYFIDQGHEVHLASTFPFESKLKFASIETIPVAYSGSQSVAGSIHGLLPVGLRTQVRNWLGPSTVARSARKLRAIIDKVNPDLVHAMRIPYEGMLAVAADPKAPLLISVWGNDFTLHARSNPFMATATGRAMQRTDALHTDTLRDQGLAHKWGFAEGKPSIVLPGNGGVGKDVFKPASKPAGPQVINPRGFRAYVRNDVFFRAIPLVLEKIPNARFVCPGMQADPEAERWLRRLGLEGKVDLLPKLNANDLAAAFQTSQVSVSPSTHDGTPNTLLEAMACGCLPVAGDLESIREWITPGQNGLLVDPKDPRALADAIVRGLMDAELRERAAQINADLVARRADYNICMPKVESFYRSLLR